MQAWARGVGLAAVVAPPALLLALVDPERSGGYPVCPFRHATGLDCPGCGTLRGLHDLVTGNPLQAMDHNLLMVLFLPVLAVAAYRWVREAPPPAVLHARVTGWAVLGVVVGWAVLRNLPLPALHLLAST